MKVREVNNHHRFVGSLLARELPETLKRFVQSLQVVLDMDQQLLDGVKSSALLSGLVINDTVEVTSLLGKPSKVILWTAFVFV